MVAKADQYLQGIGRDLVFTNVSICFFENQKGSATANGWLLVWGPVVWNPRIPLSMGLLLRAIPIRIPDHQPTPKPTNSTFRTVLARRVGGDEEVVACYKQVPTQKQSKGPGVVYQELWIRWVGCVLHRNITPPKFNIEPEK